MTDVTAVTTGEKPNVVYGRLLESAHISGYSFERTCSELEWLLNEDRWRQVGAGYEDINAFLGTVDLSPFNMTATQRKSLVKKLDELKAAKRASARALGVDDRTVRRDLAADAASEVLDTPSDQVVTTPPAADAAGEWFDRGHDQVAGSQKARVERVKRDQEAELRRVERARQDAEAQPEPGTVDIRCGDFRQELADLQSVDAIITDPPYPAEFLPLLGDLAAWADKVLTPDGVLAVLMGSMYLPDVFRLLDGHRPYRWTCCYLMPGPGGVCYPRRVQSNWKPLLVYGGGPRLGDVVRSTGDDKQHHYWGQNYEAFQEIIGRLTEPGQTVVDPFMGGGTTLLAAHALGRHAIGCDIDPEAVATARDRLA